MEELISMTQKELTSLEMIQKLEDKKLTQAKAAKYLCLSTRQIKRLCKRYRDNWQKGIISRKRGAIGNHRLSDNLKNHAIELIWSKYPDFEPTLAKEKLLEIDSINLSYKIALCIKFHFF